MIRVQAPRHWLACAVMLVAWAVPVATQAAVINETWSFTTGGRVDGVTLVDFEGDGVLEIAAILRGGAFAPDAVTPGTGTLLVLNADGTLRWQRQTSANAEMVGYPAPADVDGDGLDELAACEVTEAGRCFVWDQDGSVLFASDPFFFPGMTNSGPAVADINGDGFDDLVIASFGGEVAVILGPMGTESWRLDLFGLNKELIFGHPAIGDLNNNGKLDIVVGGFCEPSFCGAFGNAGLYAINAEDGTVTWQVDSLWNDMQGFFESSGPLLTDFDNNGKLEIVATLSSNAVSSVAAFDSNGNVLWQTPLPGTRLGFTSPIAGDANHDVVPEIFVQDRDGGLIALDTSGNVLRKVDLGASSWATPALVDSSLSSRADVIAATVSNWFVLHGGDFTEIDRFDNPTAGIFPPPVHADIDGDGRTEIVTGGWFPQQLYRFDLDYFPTMNWTDFKGNARHPGSLDPTAAIGDNVATGLVTVIASIGGSTNQPGLSNNNRRDLESARQDAVNAYFRYMGGDPHFAGAFLNNAMDHLDDATQGSGAADISVVAHQLAAVAVKMLQQLRDRVASMFGANHQEIIRADQALTTAKAALDAGNFETAVDQAADGLTQLRQALDGSFNFQQELGNFCPSPIGEPYHLSECELLDAWSQLETWRMQFPNNGKLQDAQRELVEGLAWWPDLNFDNALANNIIEAVNILKDINVVDTTAVRAQIAAAVSNAIRNHINEGAIARGPDSGFVQDANQAWEEGELKREQGAYKDAVEKYLDAYNKLAF